MKHNHGQVIDAHLHLDDRIEGGAINSVRELDMALKDSNIARGVVLHLQVQRWGVEEVAEALASSERLAGMINVHPFDDDCESQLRKGIEDLKFIGLKMHPRIQKYSLDDPRTHKLVQAAGEIGVPVVIDAFPDGDWLMQGFDPLAFARLAKACPNSKILIAHFGGHYCIDFMMLAKRLPNVYFDVSFSLMYYRGSSVVNDILYCCKSMKYDRVLYGSDYPDRSIAETLKGSLAEMEGQSIPEDGMRRLLSKNAEDFFGWEAV